MATVVKNKRAASRSKTPAQSSAPKKVYDDRISDEVGNYEKHPFFVKKANDMKEFLEKEGMPKRLAHKGH
jgi:hypothetical protein